MCRRSDTGIIIIIIPYIIVLHSVAFYDVRLVYDRETGKPKGYGFCEYQDLETAQSAMRNLNNHDFNGRPLRVGVAAGEQSKDENRGMQQALGGPATEVMLDIGYMFHSWNAYIIGLPVCQPTVLINVSIIK